MERWRLGWWYGRRGPTGVAGGQAGDGRQLTKVHSIPPGGSGSGDETLAASTPPACSAPHRHVPSQGACHQLGVSKASAFDTEDLYEGKNLPLGDCDRGGTRVAMWVVGMVQMVQMVWGVQMLCMGVRDAPMVRMVRLAGFRRVRD